MGEGSGGVLVLGCSATWFAAAADSGAEIRRSTCRCMLFRKNPKPPDLAKMRHARLLCASCPPHSPPHPCRSCQNRGSGRRAVAGCIISFFPTPLPSRTHTPHTSPRKIVRKITYVVYKMIEPCLGVTPMIICELCH